MNNKRVLKLLKTNGFRHTPQRRAIIKTLVESKGPMSVRDIYDRVQLTFEDMSPDTVYRNLKLLCHLGIVSEIKHHGKKGNSYELDGKPHHHHLVCISCGKSVCLPKCNIEKECQAVAGQANFQVIGHIFEIHGYCSECQKGS